MKSILKISVLLAVIMLLFGTCQNEADRKAQNIETFARLYGYARWFHPSDEAQDIDWNRFAVLGIQKVENIKSKKELRDTLFKLFSPIVQGLQIYEADQPEDFNPDILLSPDPDTKPIAWQHHGIYLGMQGNVYKSARTNKIKVDEGNYSIIRKVFTSLTHLSGKKIKLSGYFKIKNPTNRGQATLFVLPFANIKDMQTYNIKHKVSIKSQDWEKYELELTIPRETIEMNYGLMIEGDGEVWADDFRFLVNNDGKWEPADTVNVGFEHGKIDKEQSNDWREALKHHAFEISGDESHSGKYCLKVNYTGKMYDRMPQFGEVTREPIGNNLVCVVPLVLQTNDTTTFPNTDIKSLAQLKSEISGIELSSSFNPQVNLASVVIVWNVLQHFFPYFDVVDTDWDQVLGETLRSTLTNERQKDFFVTLSRMVAKIEDGHGVVYSETMYHLPIRTELIENEIVVTVSNDEVLEKGDIIRKIDGKSAMEALNEIEERISGSPHLRRHRALNIFGSKFDSGMKTNLLIDRDGKEQNVTISNISNNKNIFFNSIEDYKYSSEKIVEIEPGIYYVNMANCNEKDFDQKIDVLVEAKAIIYDQRWGVHLSFFHIVPYLVKEPVISTWWNVPRPVYPNRKAMEFSKSNWNIQPKQPLFKSKNIIMNAPLVVSSGETMMSIIDHYQLATTVGEPTAGCNGNINFIELPCEYRVMWTGMKVLKHDDSQLYLKGFQPDYPVSKTIQAIKEGRDECLEKALEIAREPRSL